MAPGRLENRPVFPPSPLATTSEGPNLRQLHISPLSDIVENGFGFVRSNLELGLSHLHLFAARFPFFMLDHRIVLQITFCGEEVLGKLGCL